MRHLLMIFCLMCFQLTFAQVHNDLSFTVEGFIINKKTKKPIINANVSLLNDCDSPLIKSKTDSNGYFIFKNLYHNCCFRINAEKISNYISSMSNNIYTRGKMQSSIMRDTLQLFPISGTICGVKGTPTLTINHIYFKGKSSKTSYNLIESHSIQNIMKFYNKFPNTTIEIHAHTSNNVSKNRSYSISKRRAKNISDKLIKQGFPVTQIKTFAHGKSLPIYKCPKTPCNKEKQAKNNRVEFKITYKEAGKKKIIYSHPIN